MAAAPTPARVYEGRALNALLPHRYPFLLVDRIEVIEPGHQVVGIKQLTIGEWWCESAETAIPAVLLLEGLAQTSGALIPDLAAGMVGAIAYFMGAERVRLRGAARVGDEVRFEVRLTQWRRGICRTVGEARVADRVIVRASMVTIVRGAGAQSSP